jgi:uncharacterized protein YjiS (DUF1127 family)
MSRTLSQAPQAASIDELLKSLTDGAAGLVQRMHQHRTRAHSRRMLSGLSDQQLADIGIDRATIAPARPAVAVEPGLMAKLMSLR